MSSIWMKNFYSTEPEQFEQLSPEQWRQNVNIVEGSITNEDPITGETTEEQGYLCETRILTDKEYRELVNTLYTPAQEETKQMMNNSDDNQTILMEALAEIYEKLEMLAPTEEG